METDIDQVDVFKERVQRALIDTSNAIRVQQGPTTSWLL